MAENRTVEGYVSQAINDALQCQSIQYRSGEYITERYYKKIMREVENCNVKEVSRDLACTQIENLIYKIAFVCTGGHRTLTNDERWLVNNAVNELMAMFTGYTIAAE